MGKVLIGIGAIVVAAVVVAALYFKGNVFHGSPSARQSHWVAAPFVPGNRPRAKFALDKHFGPWRLTCTRLERAPKVGFIQNLGVVPGEQAKPLPCQVAIRMQDEAAPLQTMILGFRYKAGSANPDVFVLYTTLGKPNIIITPFGQLVDLDKKEKVRGGGYMGQFASKNSGYQEAKAQDVYLQLPRHRFALSTATCRHAHCNARYLDADVGSIGSGAKIVVRLPAPPHGQRRDVVLPSEGLDSALVELRRLSQS
jgi:hypothetical protein